VERNSIKKVSVPKLRQKRTLEIGDDLVETSLRLRANQTDAALWGERIGFDAVYAVGGTLLRTAE
jgi:hypothetical protein